MRSTAELRREWTPHCDFDRRTLTLHSGATLRGLNAKVYEAFQAMDGVMRTFNYVPRANSPGAWETGAFNCRKITGGSGFSLHAYGIAADINARSNPFGSRLITDMPLAMVTAIKAIRTSDGLPIFRWGGNYGTIKDAMHYEIVASPAELAAGVDWVTVVAEPPDPSDPRSWPTLRKSDRGDSVKRLNELLVAAGFPDTNTTVFGATTYAAVLAYQTSRKLSVDGIVGIQTWTSLLNDLPEIADTDPSPFKVEVRATPDRPMVKKGSHGSVVEELQRRLIDLAFDAGPIDGVFENMTRAAVVSFQTATGLQPDGICGKLTWGAVLA